MAKRRKQNTASIVIIAVSAAIIIGCVVLLVSCFSGNGEDAGESSVPAVTTTATTEEPTTVPTTTTTVPTTTTTAAPTTTTAAPTTAPTAPPTTPVATTTTAPAVNHDENNAFFTDTLFIGDSRTVGIQLYGKVNTADFFASTGMNVYRVCKNEAVEVKGIGTLNIDQLLAKKTYRQVYILFGINELAFPSMNNTLDRYNTLIDKVQAAYPNAQIVVGSCIHVTEIYSNKNANRNNNKVNEFNGKLKALTVEQGVKYVDANPLFDDAKGFLTASYSGDGVHLSASCYPRMLEYFRTH